MRAFSLPMPDTTAAVLDGMDTHIPPGEERKTLEEIRELSVTIGDTVEKGLGLQRVITLNYEDASGNPQTVSKDFSVSAEEMSMDEMLKSVVVSSANDCATALAEHVAGSEEAFVALMNQRASELGMEHTHFLNCTGLPAFERMQTILGEQLRPLHSGVELDLATR